MIRPSSSRARPFERIATSNGDFANLLQAERDATPVLLNDWNHNPSDAIYSQYFKTGAFPYCVDSILANGYGRVQCLPESVLQAGVGLGLDTGMPGMSGMVVGDSIMSASTAMQRMSTNDPDMSSVSAMPDMSTNDPSMAAETAMQEMSMDHPMRGSLTGTMIRRSASPKPLMPRISMNDPMTGFQPESSVPTATNLRTPVLSISSMASESSSTSNVPSRSGMPPMSSANAMSSMQGMGPLNPKGCTPPMMFRPGFNITSLPPQTCSNTTSPLFTINAHYMRGWLALNLVNAGGVSKLAVSLDSHSMFVYAADGLFTALQEVKVSSSSLYIVSQTDFFTCSTCLLANDTP